MQPLERSVPFPPDMMPGHKHSKMMAGTWHFKCQNRGGFEAEVGIKGSEVSAFYDLQEVAERGFENMCFTSILPFITLH